eukprot:TRINITY_DN14277_c0_g1_i1.p1 TRINITY_DN14277_c0_g1~~TRINITY_DN14277_c0_g1_i1.p1  ORF type:complete len:358 (+),score=84.32 TRINITY_DN14277_c0_g1_i1:81-1076(+)
MPGAGEGPLKLLATAAAAVAGAAALLYCRRRRGRGGTVTVVHCVLPPGPVAQKELDASKAAWKELGGGEAPGLVVLKHVRATARLEGYDSLFRWHDPVAENWGPAAVVATRAKWKDGRTTASDGFEGVASYWARNGWDLLESKTLDYSDVSSQACVLCLLKRSGTAGNTASDYLLLASSSLRRRCEKYVRIHEAGEAKCGAVVDETSDGQRCTVRLLRSGRLVTVPAEGVEEVGMAVLTGALFRFIAGGLRRAATRLGLDAGRIPLVVCLDNCSPFAPADVDTAALGAEYPLHPVSAGPSREHIFYNADALHEAKPLTRGRVTHLTLTVKA